MRMDILAAPLRRMIKEYCLQKHYCRREKIRLPKTLFPVVAPLAKKDTVPKHDPRNSHKTFCYFAGLGTGLQQRILEDPLRVWYHRYPHCFIFL
jgi:hypothetical protein